MVYDAARGRAVLVGGTTSGGTVSGATLEFDGAAWHAVAPAGPLPRRTGHAMAYDSARGVVVLFGGLTGAPETLSSTTYEYDGVAWRIVATPASPSARQWHAMAYDSARGVVVMCGGVTAAGVAGDTWEYDGVTWTPRGPMPGPRFQHAAAYDAPRARTVVFSGRTSTLEATQYASTTVAWDGAAWTALPGQGPPARTGAAMAFSPVSQTLLLVGGRADDQYLSGAWALGAAGWTPVSTAGTPAGRSGACLAFHAGAGQFVMATGQGAAGPLGDSWLLSGGGAGFTQQPQPQQGAVGGSVALSAAAAGAASWQWRRNGEPLADDGRTTGAHTPTLTISPLTLGDAGHYDVVAGTACGTLASDTALVTVAPACGDQDFNGDGDFGTDQDIEAFFACLAGACCPACYAGGQDFNGDGDFGTDQDIESFFRVLAGGPC